MSVGFILGLLSLSTIELRDSSTVVSGSIGYVQYLRISFLFSSMFLYFIANRVRFILLNNNIFIFYYLYLIICCLSLFWSQSFFVTFFKLIETFVMFLYIFYIIDNIENEKGQILIKLFFSFYLIIISLACLLGFFRVEGFYNEVPYGILGQYIGFRPKGFGLASNMIGYVSGILLLLLQFNTNLYKNKLTFSLLLTVLLLSSSRTSLFLYSFSLLFYWFLKSNFKKKIISLTIISSIYIYQEFILSFFLGGQGAKEVANLSGRTVMWENAIDFIRNNNFWTGNGWGIGSRHLFKTIDIGIGSEFISSIHNSFIEVILNVGILGFIPWLLFLLLLSFRYIFFKNYLYKHKFNFNITIPFIIGSAFMSSKLGSGINFINIMVIFYCFLNSQTMLKK